MKTTFITGLAMAATIISSAQVNGPYNGSLFSTSSISGSTQTWSNVNNVQASDDSYASFGNLGPTVGNHSDYLTASGFGFNLPFGAVVYGIKVDVERSDPNGKTADYSVRIIRAGLIGSTERSTGIAYPVSDGTQSYGSNTDLWGETWSYKDIDNDNFGVAIAAQRNVGGGITAGQIDAILVTVYWGFITLPVNLVSFDATKTNQSVKVEWRTATESNLRQYLIERSGDGRIYYTVGSVLPVNQSDAHYSFTDDHPLAGDSYYRLRIEENTGNPKFSRIVPINFSKYTSGSLSPSPWTKGMEMMISNPGKERLTIRFFNAGGRELGKTTTTNNLVSMPVMSDARGLVYYKVSTADDKLKGSGTLVVY